MDLVEIRRRFTEHYENMGYQSLPRAPMIDPSIPMSFVMSAGLIQVENSLAKTYRRDGNQYYLIQKCFRHFDLDKVGTDDIHLSLFEMPGAFVFGENNKPNIIHKMWDLATTALEIPKDRIWASYFKGDIILRDSYEEDRITKQTWLKVGMPENHIVGLGKEHNFWIQGTGINGVGGIRKCGPNTELFYDRGVNFSCSASCQPGCKCGRFVEFSNSLFINSEISKKNDSLYPAIHPFTETVIGSERVAMIRQCTKSVFDTSDLKPIVDAIHQFTSRSIILETIATQEQVIADHLRSLYFLIADGAPQPGKDGRARIIKTLIRRVITSQILLGINSERFFPSVVQCLSKIEPDASKNTWVQEKFYSYLSYESRRFLKTIERGLHKLSILIHENGSCELTDAQITYLEKNCGLPMPIITGVLQKKGALVNKNGQLNAVNDVSNSFIYNGRLKYVIEK